MTRMHIPPHPGEVLKEYLATGPSLKRLRGLVWPEERCRELCPVLLAFQSTWLIDWVMTLEQVLNYGRACNCSAICTRQARAEDDDPRKIFEGVWK